MKKPAVNPVTEAMMGERRNALFGNARIIHISKAIHTWVRAMFVSTTCTNTRKSQRYLSTICEKQNMAWDWNRMKSYINNLPRCITQHHRGLPGRMTWRQNEWMVESQGRRLVLHHQHVQMCIFPRPGQSRGTEQGTGIVNWPGSRLRNQIGPAVVYSLGNILYLCGGGMHKAHTLKDKTSHWSRIE